MDSRGYCPPSQRIITVFVLIFIFVSIFLTGLGAFMMYRYLSYHNRTNTWLNAVGEIVSISGAYGAGESVSIEVLFVNEKIGEQITIITGDPDKLLRNSEIGDKITILYDPDNPDQFNNLSGEYYAYYGSMSPIYIIIAVVSLFIGIVLVISGISALFKTLGYLPKTNPDRGPRALNLFVVMKSR